MLGGKQPFLDRREDWSGSYTDFEKSKPLGKSSDRPNILFIMADDLGWGDLSCYGNLHQQTPHLDQLAAEGVRFTDAYAAAPTCSPTRFALYTGQFAGRLSGGLQEPLSQRSADAGIPEGTPTLPGALRDYGYNTAMFGKWHCGWLPWFSPQRIGFDEFFGNMSGGCDYFSHLGPSGLPDLYEGEKSITATGYYTELITDRSVDFIRRQAKGRPFYLQVNYTAPHWPWEGPDDEEVSKVVTQALAEKRFGALYHHYGGSREAFAKLVMSLDKAVGELLSALEDSGLADNTIVVFTSDNGGERYSFHWPLVGEKGDLEEGGIRVPCLLRWPSAIPAGTSTTRPIQTLDLTATLLEAAEVTDFECDGMSLLTWLKREASFPEHDLIWRTREQGAVRRGKYKLLVDRQEKPLWRSFHVETGMGVRLFDLEVDAREKADVSLDLPDITESLLSLWMKHDAELLAYPPSRERGSKGRSEEKAEID